MILLQRSEGGGLGMGGNAGGLMTVRGSANLLTRTTAILAALFFATAIGLTILSEIDAARRHSRARPTATATAPAPTTVLDALNQLRTAATAVRRPLPTPTPRPAAPLPPTRVRRPIPALPPTAATDPGGPSDAVPRRHGAQTAAAPATN